MRFFEQIWTTVTCMANWLNLSRVDLPDSRKYPLSGKSSTIHHLGHSVSYSVATSTQEPGPVFTPPTARVAPYDGYDYTCNYTAMTGYRYCSTEQDRGCWLYNHKTGDRYDIYTNYETRTPTGIDRYYTLVAEDGVGINADGQWANFSKVFNQTFPGPWVQACWGDTLHVRVVNRMITNGTSIHWHGIRQLNSMEMDGVNGVTQCPIPPEHEFTYVFRLTQYGSSWYHSHYSVQYADGLQGPLTIHGPSSASYHEAKFPFIMSDWGHRSAYQAIYNRDLGNGSILLNGTGDISQFGRYNITNDPATWAPFVQTAETRPKMEIHFGQPKGQVTKRYLLRLINTSFYTMLSFSIDGHVLQVVSADFVPVMPFKTRGLNLGIGQRYNVIVEADQYANAAHKSFWVRVWSSGCQDGIDISPIAPWNVTYSQRGIVRYDPDDEEDPTTYPWPDFKPACEDETKVVPVLPWKVKEPANGLGQGEGADFLYKGEGTNPPPYNYVLADFALTPTLPYAVTPYNFQINYSDPIITHFARPPKQWPLHWVVLQENHKDDDWIYIVLNSPPLVGTNGVTLQHPIHLHGHDFAILHYSKANTPFSPRDFALSCADNKKLICDNPPRRDVVVVPPGGFVVIAFKTDNPGSWLMHCHIAFHASNGLALQILERLPDAQRIYNASNPNIERLQETCEDWFPWWNDAFARGQIQDDSGI